MHKHGRPLGGDPVNMRDMPNTTEEHPEHAQRTVSSLEEVT